MKLPPEPYAHIPSRDRIKLQSYVPEADKDLLMLVIPDRNIYALLLNHALRRTVEFINANKLGYNPADQQRLLTFIINGRESAPTTPSDGLREHPTPRPARKAVPRNGTRGAKDVGTAPKDVAHQPPVVR